MTLCIWGSGEDLEAEGVSKEREQGGMQTEDLLGGLELRGRKKQPAQGCQIVDGQWDQRDSNLRGQPSRKRGLPGCVGCGWQALAVM